MFNFQGHAQVLNVFHFCSPLSLIFSEEWCSGSLLFRIVIVFLCSTYVRFFFFAFPKFWILYFLSSLSSPSMLTRKLVRKWKSAEGNRPNFTGLDQKIVFAAIFQPFSPITKKNFFFWVKSYSHSFLFHLLGNF